MQLSVYSIEKILFQGPAKRLTCVTQVGQITVLDRHEAMISALAAGTMRVVDAQGKEHFFDVRSGFLQVSPNHEVRCIVN